MIGRARKLFTRNESKRRRVLTKSTIPLSVQKAKYAVRGRLVIRANEIEKALNQGSEFPFQKVIYCNIGNPQELGQPPLTFPRQVLSLMEYPDMLNYKYISDIFPEDVIERVHQIRKSMDYQSVGAYTHSQGLQFVRESVSDFIKKRDDIDDPDYTSPDMIFLSNGASPSIKTVLTLLIRDSNDGIFIPIPQYPLYSATIPLLGGSELRYDLDENAQWGLNEEQLISSIKKANEDGITPRALVVINPGNPTGQCLTRENIQNIIRICYENNMVILADEVYQENIYGDVPFLSFKKVLYEMGSDFNDMELFSFHSLSKGFFGECGQRGGYVELTNINKETQAEMYKLVSINLCPNVSGQIVMNTMVNPPEIGTPSYVTYINERNIILDSLKRRAIKAVEVLNSLPGIKCNPAQGAMYTFPEIQLPEKQIKEAKEKGLEPDVLYCLDLLEATGICVVPGSGFGRDKGYFFRTTFLPRDDDFEVVLDKFSTFHCEYLEKYK
eukprot:TRINITY_DN1418_c0_g1_i1.p1 TRINITY_DN1418_c0_g1~~TRINITY_DN1418_c0_g1_i1.p1  ORF type:complete len:498 (+),score=99.97 TRINITY_DN1418_c0_g1_i1:3-1496(+)